MAILLICRQNHSTPNFESTPNFKFPNKPVLVVVVARDVGALETDGAPNNDFDAPKSAEPCVCPKLLEVAEPKVFPGDKVPNVDAVVVDTAHGSVPNNVSWLELPENDGSIVVDAPNSAEPSVGRKLLEAAKPKVFSG